MGEELEQETWLELEMSLGREPTDTEFEDAINRKILNLPYEHDDWLEAVATGN